MHGIIPVFLAAVCVAANAAQSIVKDITLMKGDVTSFNLASLFPPTESSESQKESLKSNLGQLPTSYTTSLPAAFVQTFGEQSLKLSGLDLTGKSLSAYAYEDTPNKLHLMVGGTYYRLKYDQTAKTFTSELFLNVSNLSCSAIDVTSKIVVIGCLYEDQSKADFYTILAGNLSAPLTITFSETYKIIGGLRLDVNTNSDEFVVFGDAYRRTGPTDPHLIKALFVTIDASKGTMALVNSIYSINTTDHTVVEFDQLHECYMVTLETSQVFVSGLVRQSGLLDTYRCTLSVDEHTKHFSLIDCESQGINMLAITDGRVKYFPGKILPSIAVYDAKKGMIGECEIDKETEMFIDCNWSNRLLPIKAGAEFDIFVTNYNGSPCFTFTDKATGLITAAVNVDRATLPDQTKYIRFDSIVEGKAKAIMALEKSDATVLYELTFKSFRKLAAPEYNLQISADDIPAPSSGSTVYNKRSLIQVKRINPAGEIWVRVEVLDKINSKMGFTDDLPDFGGVTGGYSVGNMDRSWIYGNDLSLKIDAPALDKPVILDRVNFKFTHSKDSNVFTKLFVLQQRNLVAQDANNLYYYECSPGSLNNNECEVKQSFAFPEQGYQIQKTFTSASFPNVPSSKSIAVYLTDSKRNAYVYFFWLRDATKSVLYKIQNPIRDLHMINFKDTLLFFAANAKPGFTSNIDVFSVTNEVGKLNIWTPVTTITPAVAGLPDHPAIAPTGITSCGHSDYVVEFLTGNGYIAKFNVLGTGAADIKLRAIVKVVHPTDPDFVAIGFCPMGDEFIVWNADYSTIFSTSTANDNTIYNIGFEERGISRVTHVTCAPRSASAGIWAQNNDFSKVVITLFGNQFNAAHSKIHSIEMLESNTEVTFANTYGMTDSGIAHVSVAGGNTFVKYMLLGGPYLLTGIKDTISSPNIKLTLTSGNETRVLDYQLNLQTINRTVYVGAMRDNVTLDKGNLNIEKTRDVIGHIDHVELTNVPDSLKDVITLQPRIRNDAAPSKIDILITSQILAISDRASMYFGMHATRNIEAVYLIVDTIGFTKTYPNKAISVLGRLDDTYATIVTLTKVGGMYTINVIFHDFATKKETSCSYTTDSYLNSLKMIKVPGASPHLAIFASNKMNNQWFVYEVSKDDLTIKEWDVLTNAANVWPVETDEAGIVFYNGLRDYTFNVYSLQDATVKKGISQTGVSLSGSKAELIDVKCYKSFAMTVDCVFVTYSPVNLFSSISIDEKGLITQDPDTENYNIKSKALFNFADTENSSGAYVSGQIIDGHVVLKTLDGAYDLYKTSVDTSNQGYIYSRIPASSSANKALKNGLKFSRVHDTLEDQRTFILTATGSNEARITTLSPPSDANMVTIDSFVSQPMILKVSQELTDESTVAAKGIEISLGSFSQGTTFNITDFFIPRPPTPAPTPEPQPEPEKSSLTWLWILLIIVAIVIICVIGYIFFARKKEFGAEEDNYNKHEPFVGEGKQASKRKNSDEFN